MSKVKWTKEQSLAINEKDSNILVAAAAGSGKTAVLVERIINKIVNEKIDIDKLLVVTFTNAAASEMRERILNAIYKKLEEEPNNLRLQKQITLLNKASICTIHSFCLDVIRNNFYEIDVSPNFRIGDTSEIELLKEEILDELFEELYLKEDKQFLNLLETYTSYKDDTPLKDIIKSIYKFIQSAPFPEDWLNEKTEMFNIEEENFDFASTIWGKTILENYAKIIEENIKGLEKIKKELDKQSELEKFSQAMKIDINNLNTLYENLSSWDKTYELSKTFSFTRWPSSKKIVSVLKDEAKEKRDMLTADFKKMKEKILIYNSKEAISDIKEMYEKISNLKEIIIKFESKYKKVKLARNIIDFNDIEHLALKILVNKKDGTYVPSEVAKKYQNKFIEIAIDEYQDSNMVQEYILTSISNGKNIFMVGDVKQSIYKFRQAMPELFLNKYRTYKLKEDKENNDNLKIQLFKNFRSRKNILDTTNIIFKNIMSKELGDVDYNEDEYLYLGANYPEPKNNINFAGNTEVTVINLCENEEIDEESSERIENSILEAKYVAKKINDLINSNYQVLDKKKGYRNVTYKDIVVLLRSTSELSPIYEKEISDLGMPVYSETSTEYLNSVEINTIMSILKIIDNPMQDIPLVTVMRSMIGGFTDNDLIEIRLADKKSNFYESILKAKIQVEEKLQKKIESFLNLIESLRQDSEFLSLDELIWKIYIDTGYYNYVGLMKNGKLRQANLKMLFERAKQYESASFKGVFNFINFIDNLKIRNNDLGSAKIIGENENVIRIMSIHKSKGLEFPVVFLSSTGKNINFQDLRDKILMHQEIGFGPMYENSELKLEYPTLAKEAIKIISKKESISEEMRVLYVALTRSKEKLFITGVEKDALKSIDMKKKELELYDKNNDKIEANLVEKYKSYLDWIELVYLKNKHQINNIFTLDIVSKGDILEKVNNQKENKKDILEEIKTKEVSKENLDEIKKSLNWKYKNQSSAQIPSEISVSKIKELVKQNKNNTKYEDTENKKVLLKKPSFLIEKTELSPAERGTIMHLCLQKLNPKVEYNLNKLKNMVNDLVNKEILLKKEAESIDYNQIMEFMNSNIWKEMKKAKEISQEKPFYLNMKAKNIYKNDVEDEILVQGIMDLYYINEDNELILVDYKTDYVQNKDENILKEKYNIQLQIYKKALEQALQRKVDKVYIYSTWLNKEIEIK